MIFGHLGTGQMSPGQFGPGQWTPGQMGTRTKASQTNGFQTIGSRTNGSQIFGSQTIGDLGQVGIQGKWAPGRTGIWGNDRRYGKWALGYMENLELADTWANGHLGQMGTGAYGKRALGANGHRSNWGLKASWLLGKMNILAKIHLGKWAPRRIGTWGKWTFRGKG